MRDFLNASPRIFRFIQQLTLFLTLVGLTALLVGGVGVGNAVRSYLDEKTQTIATLKCVGAAGGTVFSAYLAQVMALAALGVAAALALGAFAPVAVGAVIDRLLPVNVAIGIYPDALALAAAFGFLTAFTFALWPIGRAREVPAAALFRDAIAPADGRPRPWVIAAAAAGAVALAGLAVATSQPWQLAAAFVGAAIATVGAFRLAAGGVMLAARAIGRPSSPTLRLAITNLYRPGAPTPSVVLSLGLGLTVLVTIALIEGNFARAIDETIPDRAPAFFFVDIQPDQLEPFRETVLAIEGTSALNATPMLRGRITAVNGIPADAAVVDEEERWVVRGDRGVSYATDLPGTNRVVDGAWWTEAEREERLVSISDAIARAFAIGPGDEITVNIVGRDVTATVASVREVDWSTIGMNFTIIYTPTVLAGAPRTYLATIEAPEDQEAAIQRAVVTRFPNITAVRVRDALDAINQVLANIATAVRAVAAITLVAGTLVLAGAIAAGHRRRVYDAVVLKVLGATRFDIARAFLVEYGLMGLVTAVIASALGTLAAWSVLTFVMDSPWVFMPSAVISTTAIAGTITLLLGFAATWRALGQKAAPLLRNE